MVGDLQGIRTATGYKLTSPALLLLTCEYGFMDMGVEGMAFLLLNHKCNSICKNLPKPTAEKLLSCLLPDKVPVMKQVLSDMLNRTSYAREKAVARDTVTY